MQSHTPKPTAFELYELKRQLRYFSIYEILPEILTFVMLIFSFVWGIVDPCVFNSSSGHGIMMLSNGFWCWLVWMLIGIVGAICTYFFSKIACSHKLLQIYYLQLLTNQNECILNNTTTDPAAPTKNGGGQNEASKTKTNS